MAEIDRMHRHRRDAETRLVLVDRRRPACALMLSKTNWERVYEDPLSVLFVRADSSLAAAVRPASVPALPADGAGRPFP